VVGNTAGQSPQRLDFAFGKPIVFRALTFGHIAKKCRHPATAWIGVNFKPSGRAVWLACLKLHRRLVRHHLPIILLERRIPELRKFLPKFAPEKFFTGSAKPPLV